MDHNKEKQDFNEKNIKNQKAPHKKVAIGLILLVGLLVLLGSFALGGMFFYAAIAAIALTAITIGVINYKQNKKFNEMDNIGKRVKQAQESDKSQNKKLNSDIATISYNSAETKHRWQPATPKKNSLENINKSLNQWQSAKPQGNLTNIKLENLDSHSQAIPPDTPSIHSEDNSETHGDHEDHSR